MALAVYHHYRQLLCTFTAMRDLAFAERVQFARIEPWQRRQQRRGPLLELQRVTAEQRQRACHAALRSIGGLDQSGIIGCEIGGMAGGTDDIVDGQRPQQQLAASGQDRRQNPGRCVADEQEQRALRRQPDKPGWSEAIQASLRIRRIPRSGHGPP